ncbi:PA0069 family radical SAM protein [Bradyrhizobium prioriisuperbiae]|uniref:PA0069 family radical SAM protein n=1 Tax=Bradyrhizobium prioriisuperbiae TaxID=2854389 RepID=UPI0028E6BA79|nr:PA0069 family radical SAM protein [Bradyrhizobium prioritasuperba]
MSPAARSKSSAPKKPPLAPVPSAPPVGAVAPFGEPGTLVDPGTILDLGTLVDKERRRGRGAQSNASGRFEAEARVAFDDGWQSFEDLPPFKTTVGIDTARKVITRNDSPDIGFDRSINPYRGCEHGCVYCFARPTHAYMGLSPGLDFESKLFAKPDAPALLEKELAASDYEPRMIAIGTNTDPYQPIEREYKIMRGILEVLERVGHPVGIVTKSALVMRDVDILSRMAKRNLVKVALSVTTMDPKLARTMEPRAATPAKRLEALRALSEAGVPTTVMVAPIIPALNDSEIERIIDAAAHAGVKEASYVLLRLPLEVRDLFREWLMANYPDRYRHIFTLIRDMRDGRDYDSQWGTRMKGTGPMAWMIGRRFEIACAKVGMNKRRAKLTTDHFARPKRGGQQLGLFD